MTFPLAEEKKQKEVSLTSRRGGEGPPLECRKNVEVVDDFCTLFKSLARSSCKNI